MYSSKLILFLVTIKLKSSCVAQLFQECKLGQNEIQRVQMVFLVDGALSPKSNFSRIQREHTKEFMKATKLKQPNAEFAVAAYYSWQGNNGNCYKLLQSFTTDQDKINSQIAKLAGEPGDNVPSSKSSFTMALTMVIADKNLAWDRNQDTVSTGRWTRKFVVSYPLKKSIIEVENSGDRRDPIGDGSDTCQNSNPPTGDFIHHTYWRDDFYLININYPILGDKRQVFNFYIYEPMYLGYMDRGLIYCAIATFYDIRTQSKGTMENFKGINENEKQQWTEERVGKADMVTISRELFSMCISHEISKCEFEVENGYNTLGL